MRDIISTLANKERRDVLKILIDENRPLTLTEIYKKSKIFYKAIVFRHLCVLLDADLISSYSPLPFTNYDRRIKGFYKLSERGRMIRAFYPLLEQDVKRSLELLGFKSDRYISENSVLIRKEIIKTLYENKKASTPDLINSSPDIRFKCDKMGRIALKVHINAMNQIINCRKIGRRIFIV